MYEKGKRSGMVRFAIRPSGAARKVAVAGEFSQWQPTPMRKQKDGAYVASVELRPGVYQYKFLVDEQWVTDPDHSDWATNEFGATNSVVHVG